MRGILLYLLMLGLFCIGGCVDETRTLPKGEIPFDQITNFEHNNHKYIKFGYIAGKITVLHDPDCHCLKSVDKK